MSRLRDRIRETLRRRPTAIGFATRSAAVQSQRRLVVVGEGADSAAATRARELDLDAVLVRGEASAIAPVVQASNGLAVGADISAATAADVAQLVEAKADFLVFDDTATEAAALLSDEIGHVLALSEGDTSEEDLRLLAPLDLDAILLPTGTAIATVRDQLRVRRIAELTRKPLALRLNAAPTAEQLHVWRDAGALLVIVPASDEAVVRAVVEAAAAVPPPRSRDDERPMPLVPAPTAVADDFDDED